ncbi:MAG: bacteriocin [Lachnospiraceae bacterium]|nr:bacteriocin [Lachnospiraceae bacterium]
MSEEKKTAATEEAKEEARKLTDKELAQVTGGNIELPGTHDSSKSYDGGVFFENNHAQSNGGAIITPGDVELGENVRFIASNER